jgi:hypothetical protein
MSALSRTLIKIFLLCLVAFVASYALTQLCLHFDYFGMHDRKEAIHIAINTVVGFMVITLDMRIERKRRAIRKSR